MKKNVLKIIPYFAFTPPSLSIYIYISVIGKLATVAEGDQKAPFSIATTPRCRGGRYSFPLYPRYVPYHAEL